MNPAAVAAMAEVGIHISAQRPRRSDEVLAQTDVVAVGCGDACLVVSGVRYEDWPHDDPAGLGVDAVRPIRRDRAARA